MEIKKRVVTPTCVNKQIGGGYVPQLQQDTAECIGGLCATPITIRKYLCLKCGKRVITNGKMKIYKVCPTIVSTYYKKNYKNFIEYTNGHAEPCVLEIWKEK